MKILGIDPSLSCTGWCLIDSKTCLVMAGEIRSDPEQRTTSRITHICHELQLVMFPFGTVKHKVFTESEANGAKGKVIDLAHLNGVIQYSLRYHSPMSFPPSLARKYWLGKGIIPFDKKKESKKYCEFIRSHSGAWLSDPKFDSLGPDAMDACVIALCGLKEYQESQGPIYYEPLVFMRLHDEKILTKYKGKYSYGSGKKKQTFKTMNKLDAYTKNLLLEKYRCILEGTQLHNSQNGSTCSEY